MAPAVPQVQGLVRDETIDGGPGDIVIGLPDIPHGVTNLGPGPARLVCIHGAPAMRTEFLS
jgi:quercetin dioxygenase-like cupin family protein